MNSAASLARSRIGVGTTPSSSVARTPTMSAAEVNAPGTATVGVFSPGSDSHIITTTRRYGNARIMLVTTPAMTVAVCHGAPTPKAAWNTANLLVNPLVSGMPAKASSRNVNTPATSGARLAQARPTG